MYKCVSVLPKTKINDEKIELLFCPYMVGDILTTTNVINPNNRYKGTTWQKIEEETFLMTASSKHPVKTTGGENEHTLTVEEMPKHKHTVSGRTGQDSWTIGDIAMRAAGSNPVGKVDTNEQGQGLAHNNMPKFYAVYFWLRVA